MAYDTEKARLGREFMAMVEFDMDYCANTAGVSPCTATETGDDKCYNTYGSCNDRANYVKTIKTYKFCTKTANKPLDQNLIACIEPDAISTSPSKIIPGKSLGTRTSVDITLNDSPHHDRGFDPYYTERSWYPNADQRGTFFGKFRARNKYYNMRDARVKYGFISPNGFDANDFVTHHYVIESMEGPSADHKFRITLNDTLKKANYDRAQCPMPSQGKLLSAIAAGATSATLTPTGIGDSEYPASGYLAIDSEIVTFTRSGDTLTLVRGVYGDDVDHAAGVTVQLCYSVATKNVIDIIYELLVTYAGVDSALIPYADWTQEKEDYLSIYNLTSLVHEPTGVSTLLDELIKECGLLIAWDEQNQSILLKAVRSGSTGTDFTDSNIIKGTFVSKDKPNERLSQIWYHYDWKTPFDRSNLQDFNTVDIFADADSEGANKYNETRQEKIFSRWVFATGIATEVASRKLKRYKDNPRYIDMTIDIRNSKKIGDYVGIESDGNQDESGAAGLEGYQVISAQPIEKYSKQRLELMFMPFNRYGKIAPNGTPDYTSASQFQKDNYCFICDTTTLLMSNGDDPYVTQ